MMATTSSMGGGSKGEYHGRAVPVDTFAPNPWGLFVSQGRLCALYAGASAFCYLSEYEGFGLPPLEATRSLFSRSCRNDCRFALPGTR